MRTWAKLPLPRVLPTLYMPTFSNRILRSFFTDAWGWWGLLCCNACVCLPLPLLTMAVALMGQQLWAEEHSPLLLSSTSISMAAAAAAVADVGDGALMSTRVGGEG